MVSKMEDVETFVKEDETPYRLSIKAPAMAYQTPRWGRMILLASHYSIEVSTFGVRESLRRNNNNAGYPKGKHSGIIIHADGIRRNARISGWLGGEGHLS